MRQQYCNPAIFTLYQDPLMIVEGHMQYLYDETGRRYLDLFAGIVTVSCGHSHPKVVARMKEQLDLITHTTTIYLHPNFPAMAKKLASKMPQGLDVTYFTNSGSEANDLAMLIARLYTGSNDIIAVRNSYHGNSPTAMAATSHHTWKYPAQLNSGIHHAISPDPYRSPFSGTPEQVASQAADDIRQLIRYSTPGRVAGFIAEPIQGVGGATHGASNYLKEAYAVIRENGGLCIADEVQTGFGRTGDHYWGFQNFGVVPDIVTMAKGIGNGAPLAAVTTRRDIASVLTQRVHFNTFGGNPVSMAAGLAVLDTIDEDGLQENSKVVGGPLQAGAQGAADPPSPDRRRPRYGAHARRGAGPGPRDERTGQGRDLADPGDRPGARRVARQGRPGRQRAPDQAAHVSHGAGCGLCPRSPGRGAGSGGEVDGRRETGDGNSVRSEK